MANNKEPQNCWEYWNCPTEIKQKCDAYKIDSGRVCWEIAKCFDIDSDPKCPQVKNKFKYRSNCPWYKVVNKPPACG